MPSASRLVSLRVTAAERDLLEAAAAHNQTSLSKFVRREALAAAQTALANNKVVTIEAADWDRFESWASAPARDVPALRSLANTRPVWQG